MRRAFVLAIVLAAVGLLGFVALANVLTPADAAVPARISGYLDAARDIARGEAGPAAWWPMPLRLALAGCAPDHILVVYAFDGFFPSGRSYVAIQLPSVADSASPGAATVIGPLTRDEFEDPARNLSAVLAQPCA